MVQVRRRVKQLLTLEQRLADEAQRLIEEAKTLPPGSRARDVILRRAEQAQAAARIDQWLRSPNPPK
jgi:hypothetical protein